MKNSKKNKQINLVKSVYLHIPFCRKICPFCPFPVIKDGLNSHEEYVFGIIKEIENRIEFFEEVDSGEIYKKKTGIDDLESIYIGGGTPSRLKKDFISLLINKVNECFTFSDKIEITVEINPEDVTEKYINDLCKTGVNRISLGAQSFGASTLYELGRSHNNKELREAIQIIKNSDINNWNMDLIFGVYKQSKYSFQNDLEEAILYRPNHISLYGLEIHKNTRFGKNKGIIEWESNHQEQFREMYLWAIKKLKKSGLFQYEVSNFSQKGKESRNNLLVWSGVQYLGFGVGAHSFFNKSRFSNKRSIKAYLKNIHENKLPINFEEKLSKNQLATEFLMLNLRQNKGFNYKLWQNYFGLQFQKKEIAFVESLCESGLAFWKGSNLCLTPEGFLIVDKITLELLNFEKNPQVSIKNV